jgi:hypothetical protein
MGCGFSKQDEHLLIYAVLAIAYRLLLYMIVGAISYNAILKDRHTLQHIPDCLVDKNNNATHAFRVSARRKNEIRDDCFKGLVGIDIARTLQSHFGEKVEPDHKGLFKGTKSGMQFHVEKMRLIRLAGKQPEKGQSLWVTQEAGHELQYWLAADTMDVSAFLKAYMLAQINAIDAYSYTLQYVVDERFAPFATGSAEYGPDRAFNFSRHAVPLSTPQL